VAAIGQHADNQKQRAGADAVREHLVDRALHPLHVHRRDAERHEPEMADARVCDQLFQVRLHHCDERAVNDADDRGDTEIRREVQRGIGKQRKRKPH
jgi:hypothetical protein